MGREREDHVNATREARLAHRRGLVFLGADAEIPVRPNIGAGVAMRPWPRLGIEFEFNQNLGRSGPYGSVAQCSGSLYGKILASVSS